VNLASALLNEDGLVCGRYRLKLLNQPVNEIVSNLWYKTGKKRKVLKSIEHALANCQVKLPVILESIEKPDYVVDLVRIAWGIPDLFFYLFESLFFELVLGLECLENRFSLLLLQHILVMMLHE
jgi:hypothetical protein